MAEIDRPPAVPNDADPQPDELSELLNRGFRYAVSLCSDTAEAEDLVQEACASILKISGPWQRQYFFRTIKNHFIDRYRRKRRLRFVPIEGATERGADPIKVIEDQEFKMPDVIAAAALERALATLRISVENQSDGPGHDADLLLLDNPLTLASRAAVSCGIRRHPLIRWKRSSASSRPVARHRDSSVHLAIA